jgi:tetratricopeptide (TPR) repeat protein
LVNRPGEGGGGTQWTPGNHGRPDGWRPGDNDRPGLRPDGWRPGDNDRPGPRPGGIWGSGNRLGSIIGSGNTVVGGNTINQTTNNLTNVTNQQSWISGNWNSGNRYGGRWGANYGSYVAGGGYGYPSYYSGTSSNWYSGSWSNWASYPAMWLGSAAAGWLGASAVQSYAYSNPYASNLAATSFEPAYSYSNPIPEYVEPRSPATVVINAPQGDTTLVNAPQPAAAPASPALVAPVESAPAAEAPEQTVQEDPKVKDAAALFDEGRGLFKTGDVAGAQAKVDKAIGIFPQDRALHEFRALMLFAQGKYQEAASTLYAVLSAGPGWNWDTVRAFYPNVDTYTRQLRALEAYAKQKPKSADARFVLAYHYLVTAQPDAAVKLLEQVHSLLPDDQLSAQILTALKPKPQGEGDAPRASTG